MFVFEADVWGVHLLKPRDFLLGLGRARADDQDPVPPFGAHRQARVVFFDVGDHPLGEGVLLGQLLRRDLVVFDGVVVELRLDA